MPDTLDTNGLTIKTNSELVTELTNKLKDTYGNDINVASNSPDGQQINIYCQASVDTREVLQKVYNSFDPDLAEGRTLDQRVALNNIKRNEGTFTFQDIEITTDKALNLVGLDGDANELNPEIPDLYIVKDDEGTEFYLLASQTIVGAGTNAFTFRAKELGKVETIPNTITTPVTIISGVTAINNPSGANSIGTNEETDIELKLRRKNSTTINAIGPADSLEASLNNLSLVTFAKVYENYGTTTDVNGIPAHTIWCIIEGGDPDDIGQIIYSKRTMGCGMKGSETVNILRPDGSYFVAKYDTPTSQNLWIKFSITLPGGFVDEATIKSLIVQYILWGVGASAKSSTITAYLQGLNSDYVIENMQVSDDDITYTELVAPTSIQHRFINDITRITIL